MISKESYEAQETIRYIATHIADFVNSNADAEESLGSILLGLCELVEDPKDRDNCFEICRAVMTIAEKCL